VDLQCDLTTGTRRIVGGQSTKAGLVDLGHLGTEVAEGVRGRSWFAIGSHPHYRTGRTEVRPDVSRQVIRLRPGTDTTIAGRVVTANGDPAGAGFRVVAWPMDGTFPAGAVRGMSTRRQGVGVATSGASGRFVVEGLDPHERYRLTAGKRGYLAREPTGGCSVSPGSEEMLVRVDRVFGASVHLRHPGGDRLRTSPKLFGDPGGVWTIEDGSKGRIFLPDPSVTLAGIDSKAAMSRDRGDHLVLYREQAGRAARGPASFQIEIPGYVQLDRRFELSPLEDGLADYQVELEPKANVWGDLVLGFDGREHRTWGEVHRRFPLAKAVLQDREGETFNFAVHEYTEAGVVVAGIPAGEYSLRIRNQDRYFVWPPPERNWPERVFVGGETSVYIVDCSSLGDLLVVPVQADGEIYEGRGILTSVAIRGEKRGNRVRTRFERAPYILEGITACRYEVYFARESDWELGGRSSPSAAEVLRGSLVEVTTALD